MTTNLRSPFFLMQETVRIMRREGVRGTIVNVGSIAAHGGPTFLAPYSASKAGQNALTACMVREMGQHQIRVNSICPGLIDASRMDNAPRGKDTARQEGVRTAPGPAAFDWDEHVNTQIPLGRAGQGADVANAVVYLCSEQGAWITGQSINVDGGNCVWH